MKIRRVPLVFLSSMVLASQCHAMILTLPNGSFENPDFTDGSGLAYIDPGLVYGWNWIGPINRIQFGVSDPTDFHFLGTTGNGANRLPAPADGYQYAFLGGWAQSVSSIQNPVSLGMIQPFTRYALGVAAINTYAQHIGSGLGTLQLSLLAGAVPVATASIDYGSFGFGQIRLLESSFTTGGDTDLLVGQELNVRVTYTADFYLGSNGYFDNLVLTATPVPEPASGLFMLGGCIGLLSLKRRKYGEAV
jgi:hypothetical protein